MAPELDPHPCVQFGEARGWDYSRTAKYFEVPYGVFKQMVRGFTGCSLARAERFERRTKGKIKAIDVLRWHESNRRESSAKATA